MVQGGNVGALHLPHIFGEEFQRPRSMAQLMKYVGQIGSRRTDCGVSWSISRASGIESFLKNGGGSEHFLAVSIDGSGPVQLKLTEPANTTRAVR